MSAIMIKCPNTDRDVFTGIEIDFVSFNRLPNVLSHSYCPACGHEHHWRRGEAWLAPSGTETLSVDVAARIGETSKQGPIARAVASPSREA